MDLQKKSRFESEVKTRIRVSEGPESKTFRGERSDLGMWRRWRLLEVVFQDECSAASSRRRVGMVAEVLKSDTRTCKRNGLTLAFI